MKARSITSYTMRTTARFVAGAVLFFWGVTTELRAVINPTALSEVGDYGLTILSPTVLEVSLVTTKAADPALVTEWNFVGSNFTPAVPNASEFQVMVGGTTVGVTEVGFKRRPLYAPLRVRDLRIGNYLYLRLAAPIADGQSVTVRNPS